MLVLGIHCGDSEPVSLESWTCTSPTLPGNVEAVGLKVTLWKQLVQSNSNSLILTQTTSREHQKTSVEFSRTHPIQQKSV